MARLRTMQIGSVVVEGGAGILSSFLAARLADQVEIVITRTECLPWLAETGKTLGAIALDRVDDAQEWEANPDSGVIAENLSTIFSTFGSTGTPNAVMSPHRVACGRLLWSQAHASPIGPVDRTVLCTSIGFGAFLGEWRCPGLVCLGPYGARSRCCGACLTGMTENSSTASELTGAETQVQIGEVAILFRF
jgi:acyl-coenzyme A synthetase/AMP-(fatty) acid ligase